MTIDIATGVQTITKYYELRRDPALEALDADGAAREYGRRLQEATILRLRSDVRVGTCLSGGLDSSAIAALAAGPYREARGEPFCAITAVSEQASNDESAFAEMVVKRANLDWIRVRPVYADFAASLHDIVIAQEEPFDGPSICMQYFVMKAAREARIPVLLDGQGGDETLLGYRIYFAAYLLSQYHTHGVRAAVREFFSLRKFAADARMPLLRLIAHTLYFQSHRMQQYRARSRGSFLRKSAKVPESQAQRSLAARDIRALQVLEITKTVLPSLLRYEDKNSMRHSIETRLPFLDYRSVEAAISFAPETKIHHGWTKYPLRKFIDAWLPREIAWRRTKVGFEAPDEIWMRMHKSEMQRVIGESVLVRSLTKPNRFQNLGDSVDKSTFWRLYSVALWEQALGVT
jgi:asparagine synthase (glutamine-hydrolysing)